jgi:hypothetical protein
MDERLMKRYAYTYYNVSQINVRGNQKWTIQRNWRQQRVYKAKKNTTQYVLDSTVRKQTHIT